MKTQTGLELTGPVDEQLFELLVHRLVRGNALHADAALARLVKRAQE